MPITPVPSSSVDPVAQVVATLGTAAATLAAATAQDAAFIPTITAASIVFAAAYR